MLHFNKRSYKKYKPYIYFGLLLAGIFIASYITDFFEKKSNDKLRLNWRLNVCVIESVRFFSGRSGGDRIEYTYYVNDENFKGDYSIGSLRSKSKYRSTKGKEWTIAYDSTDYSNSALLLKIEDYHKFDIPYSGQEVLDDD